jgi:zinc D-Ala-D-Ala dipeptidase
MKSTSSFAAALALGTLGIVACATAPLTPAPLRAVSAEEAALRARARAFDLVSLEEAIPGIWIDQRYRTHRNVVGVPFYPPGLPCLIHRDTAVKLKKAQQLLAGRGYQLRVWDAYRPPESHQVLWEKFGMTGYVHEPGYENRWSWHCYGRAVDVTLLDRNGNPMVMPSDYDEFSSLAWASYTGTDNDVHKRLVILQWAMERAGFKLLNSEWWHFSDPVEPVGRPVFAKDLGL